MNSDNGSSDNGGYSAASERAAVVAYLRQWADESQIPEDADLLRTAAEHIEIGAHAAVQCVDAVRPSQCDKSSTGGLCDVCGAVQ